MADGLAAILSGVQSGDPTAALQLQALQAENAGQIAQDPSKWSVSEFGPFASLNRAMALGNLGAAQRAIGEAASANAAANPDLVQALASPDPYTYAAQNPGMDPLAISRLVRGATPTGVAQMRNLDADAAYRQALANLQGLTAMRMGMVLRNAGGAGNPAIPGAGAATPGVLPPGLPPASAAPFGSGHYPSAAGTGAGPIPNAATPAPDAATGMPPPGPARAAWWASLPLAQRRAILGRLTPATTSAGP